MGKGRGGYLWSAFPTDGLDRWMDAAVLVVTTPEVRDDVVDAVDRSYSSRADKMDEAKEAELVSLLLSSRSLSFPVSFVSLAHYFSRGAERPSLLPDQRDNRADSTLLSMGLSKPFATYTFQGGTRDR